MKIKSGMDNEFSLSDDDIVEGNNLSADVISSDETVTGHTEQGIQFTITWNPDHNPEDIEKYSFHGQKAIIQNKRGSIWFYNCKKITHEQRECN